ncbi:MAG: hypothetical protein OXN44_06130 [Acidimicrobiaceae bacterium]|nr:hypothetical protein [Acidimicrobiaceae bacterium]MDE0605632.1 hypothetical protein [Acidimicrobiaceae bacterium]
MSSRTPKRLLVAVGVVLAASACGGDDDDPTAEPVRTSGGSASTTVRALAVVSAECAQGLVEQFLELYEEHEAALVSENRALLEQFRESRGG